MSRCKCPKSDAKTSDVCLPYFEEMTTKMEERRCDLLGRQKYLRDKITTMERSIPALIAYNMWMTNKCEDAPYCKIREIMKRFAPYPDQTEKLLQSLKSTVKEMNGETKELHEKIIQADVILEETEMELESLELVNKEMNDTLNNLEKEVRNYTTPSLHSIHSEDLLCLSKIRQLAKEELNLKNCIKELEQKETIFKDHMDRLLTSKEYQSVCGRRKIINCIQDLDCSGKKKLFFKNCICNKQNDYSKKEQGQEEIVITQNDATVSTSEQNIKKRDQETEPEPPEEKIGKKSSWIPNWLKNNQQSEQILDQTKSADSPTLSNAKTNESEKSITAPNNLPIPSTSIDEKELKGKKANSEKLLKNITLKSLNSKSKPAQCYRPCFTSQDLHNVLKKSCIAKHMPPCNKLIKDCTTFLRKPYCEVPRYTMADHGIRTGCKPFVLPCDLRDPCEICPSMPCKDYIRPVGNCRCNCKGKCARDLSDALCNCSDELDPLEGYQPTGSKQLADSLREEDSEDEFCECCTCCCQDSDESLCQCN